MEFGCGKSHPNREKTDFGSPSKSIPHEKPGCPSPKTRRKKTPQLRVLACPNSSRLRFIEFPRPRCKSPRTASAGPASLNPSLTWAGTTLAAVSPGKKTFYTETCIGSANKNSHSGRNAFLREIGPSFNAKSVRSSVRHYPRGRNSFPRFGSGPASCQCLIPRSTADYSRETTFRRTACSSVKNSALVNVYYIIS